MIITGIPVSAGSQFSHDDVEVVTAVVDLEDVRSIGVRGVWVRVSEFTKSTYIFIYFNMIVNLYSFIFFKIF